MPVVHRDRWTVEDLEQLIEGRDGHTPRYELVDGDLLVTPAPSNRHQAILVELFVLIREYVKHHRLGKAYVSPCTVALTPDSRFEPDLFVIPRVAGRLPPLDALITRIMLAAEVVSSGSARHDRITKRKFFLGNGVPDYWVVDGEAQIFEVWKPGDDRAALVDDRLIWQPVPSVPAFELDVRQFFASIED
ncbi:MAG: Uma2 family endonuclease [Gemmatimonadota bacterium]